MIDTLHACLPRAVPFAATLVATGADAALAARMGDGYGFVTVHRPSNVDEPTHLRALVAALKDVAHKLPFVFAVHPRTRVALDASGLGPLLARSGVHLTPPLSYLETIGIMQGARVVLTDSGGVQDETTALGVPCLTLRDNTERPVTVSHGTNTVIGRDPSVLASAVTATLHGDKKRGRIPDLWDGHAAERITQAMHDVFAGGAAAGVGPHAT